MISVTRKHISILSHRIFMYSIYIYTFADAFHLNCLIKLTTQLNEKIIKIWPEMLSFQHIKIFVVRYIGIDTLQLVQKNE